MKFFFPLILLLSFAMVVFPAKACDSSLLELFASESPDVSFFKKLEAITSQAGEIGSNALNSKVDSEALLKLMDLWLDFDKTYHMNPPAWAHDNSIWQEKFFTIAHQIGDIRRGAKNQDFQLVHNSSLSLSRKLNLFILEAPGSEDKKILAALPLIYNEIEGSYEARDRNELLSHAQNYKNNVKKLQENMATQTRDLVIRLDSAASGLCSLIETTASHTLLFSWKTKMYIQIAEEAYVQLNRDLLQRFKKEGTKDDRP